LSDPAAPGRTAVGGFTTRAAAEEAREILRRDAGLSLRIRTIERERSFAVSDDLSEIDITRPVCGAALGALAGSAGLWLAGVLGLISTEVPIAESLLRGGGLGAAIGGLLARVSRPGRSVIVDQAIDELTDYLLVVDAGDERVIGRVVDILQQQTQAEWVMWGHTAPTELLRRPVSHEDSLRPAA